MKGWKLLWLLGRCLGRMLFGRELGRPIEGWRRGCVLRAMIVVTFCHLARCSIKMYVVQLVLSME